MGRHSFIRRAGWVIRANIGLALAACGGGHVQPHVAIDSTANALRSAFNADSGRVRAILLASPT